MVKFFIKYAIWKFELNFESSIPSLILGFEDTLHCVNFFEITNEVYTPTEHILPTGYLMIYSNFADHGIRLF
jgi:hypothetical protein